MFVNICILTHDDDGKHKEEIFNLIFFVMKKFQNKKEEHKKVIINSEKLKNFFVKRNENRITSVEKIEFFLLNCDRNFC